MTLQELAFYVAVGMVFAIAATHAFYNLFREQRREFAVIYAMIGVLSIFVLINYD